VLLQQENQITKTELADDLILVELCAIKFFFLQVLLKKSRIGAQ
jgi:hypothetical protein